MDGNSQWRPDHQLHSLSSVRTAREQDDFHFLLYSFARLSPSPVPRGAATDFQAAASGREREMVNKIR